MEHAPEPEQITNADLVAEFHRAVSASLPDQPTVPDAELLALRRSLLAEEYREVTDEMERLRELIVTSSRGRAIRDGSGRRL